MKDIILTQLVAPLVDNESDYLSAARDMSRIEGFSARLEGDALKMVTGILERFQEALEEDEEENALKEIQKMIGYLEGYALSLET